MSNNWPGNNPVPPASDRHALEMANLSFGYHSMPLGNQTGTGPRQPARNANLPEFRSTLLTANKEFRPVIADPAHAMRECNALMRQYNAVPQVIATDIPDLRTEGQKWVEKLHNAVYDFSNTIDNPKSIHYVNLLKEDYYPEGIMHIMLWFLLTTIVQVQKGNCLMKPWFAAEFPAYRQYPTFAARFKDVENILRTSKSCCGSLYSVLDFPARVAWNPPRELNRKRRNKNKIPVEQVGGAVGELQGPTPDSNGEHEDKDDNKVVGKESIPDLSQEPNTTAPKRASKRSLVLKQLTGPKRRRRTVEMSAPPLEKGETASLGQDDPASARREGEEAEQGGSNPWGTALPGSFSGPAIPIDPRLSQPSRLLSGRRMARQMPASYYGARAQYAGTTNLEAYPQMQDTLWFESDEGQGNNLYDNEEYSWPSDAFRQRD